ncbi:MAG TPA: helix-turn-helix domain-containing protein [Planctomycetota bacterium]|nr:helix-turn-helix domain-containing protein [Planctomycetota bacterium]
MLLEYLVTSRARREVLRNLRAAGRPLAVRELARRAGVPYSNAHREVVRLRRMGLLLARRSGNAWRCSWNERNPAAKTLSAFLKGSMAGRPGEPDEDAVYWNLRRWGAPLARTGKAAQTLSLEETLAHGLGVARRRPEVARVWPVVMAKNRNVVDLRELELLGRRLGQKRALGFLLSLTGGLLRDRSLADLAERLRDARTRKKVDFFLLPRGPRAQALRDRKTPAVAGRWLFRMNMPVRSFRSLLRKFQGAP